MFSLRICAFAFLIFFPQSITKSMNCKQTSLSVTKEKYLSYYRADLYSNDLYFNDFTLNFSF